MRLLNVRTLKLEEFVGSVIPEYAILSHTWGEDEASFSEFAELGISRFVRGKSGYTKIKGFCKKANDDGFQHVWIDTCCIDKRSSAELSEAINSMFKWYQRAKVCYVYLEDVSRKSFDVTFSKCRWFQRGWTLQELLAPRTVRFFDNTWSYLNDKTSLAEKIATMTGISTRALLEPASIHEYSAALRMSWASKRETTRIEDSAYCLFGIFAVNMPLLYGEGEKAFLRLQEEILRNSSDCSILAWDISSQNTRDASYYLRDPSRNSALALHPKYFNSVRNIVSFPRPGIRIPHQISSDGLYINMPLLQSQNGDSVASHFNYGGFFDDSAEKFCSGLLDCHFEDDFSGCIGIPLMSTQTPNVFIRAPYAPLAVVSHEDRMKAKEGMVIIGRMEYLIHEIPALSSHVWWLKSDSARSHGYMLTETTCVPPMPCTWNEKTQIMRINVLMESFFQIRYAAFSFSKSDDENFAIGFVIIFGFDTFAHDPKIACFPRLVKESLGSWAEKHARELHPFASKGENNVLTTEIEQDSKFVTAIFRKEKVMSQEIFILEVKIEDTTK